MAGHDAKFMFAMNSEMTDLALKKAQTVQEN
jgi:hypothetical protein